MIIFISLIKVRFTQKILVKWSKCHSCEPNIASELLFSVNDMNGSDKMLIFSFFCTSRINLFSPIPTGHGLNPDLVESTHIQLSRDTGR